MAKKQKTSSSSSSTTTTTKSSGSGLNYILNVLAFVAVCVGGIALFIAMILSRLDVSVGFVNTLQTVANALGWLVLSILSFKYIRRRKKLWIWIIWIIAVVMVFMSLILIVV